MENSAPVAASSAFQGLSFEEDAEGYETIYCDEDEYIIDEFGEEVENSDYFESYEETVYGDVIHEGDHFDDIFYAASDYLEELLELRAQLHCKTLTRDVPPHQEKHPNLTRDIREILPADAFGAGKGMSLEQQIQCASSMLPAGWSSAAIAGFRCLNSIRKC